MPNIDRRTTKHNKSAAERREQFIQRLEDGNYRELFGSNLNAIFSQAVEQFAAIGLAEEIGSLRLVLARLLAEEHDLNRLATNVARIVSVTIRTVQTHHDLTGQSIDEIIIELTKTLDAVGGPIPAPDAATNPVPER